MDRPQATRAAAMVVALSLAFTGCGRGGDDAAPPADNTNGAGSDDVDTATTDGSIDGSMVDPTDEVVGGVVDEVVDDASTGDAAGAAGDGDESDDVFAPFLGDLPEPCTVITAEEIGAVIGTAVTADDTYSTDCFYEPTDVAAAGLTVRTSTLAIGDACSEFIQTEPFVPGESVEPAPEYGDLAALITSDGTSQYQVCADGIAFSVAVIGSFESNDPRAIAAEILDLLMERS